MANAANVWTDVERARRRTLAVVVLAQLAAGGIIAAGRDVERLVPIGAATLCLAIVSISSLFARKLLTLGVVVAALAATIGIEWWMALSRPMTQMFVLTASELAAIEWAAAIPAVAIVIGHRVRRAPPLDIPERSASLAGAVLWALPAVGIEDTASVVDTNLALLRAVIPYVAILFFAWAVVSTVRRTRWYGRVASGKVPEWFVDPSGDLDSANALPHFTRVLRAPAILHARDGAPTQVFRSGVRARPVARAPARMRTLWLVSFLSVIIPPTVAAIVRFNWSTSRSSHDVEEGWRGPGPRPSPDPPPAPQRCPVPGCAMALAVGTRSRCPSGATSDIQCWTIGASSCALLADRTVACWGYEGGPDRIGFWTQMRPNRAPFVRDVVRIALGGGEICTVDSGGVLRCAMLRDLYEDPVHHAPMEVSEHVSMVAMSDTERCVVRDDGTVACWTNDTRFGRASEHRTLSAIQGVDHVVEVAVADDRACARRASGTVACWVVSDHPLLRDDSLPAPVPPADVTDLHDAVQLALGAELSCALIADGTVWCWYTNERGVPSRTHRLSNLAEVTQIAAASKIACARRRNGTISCWGPGWRQGGVPLPGYSNGTGDVRSPRGVEFLDVAVSDDHACARRVDGNVYCWGSGEHGQLGARIPITDYQTVPCRPSPCESWDAIPADWTMDPLPVQW